MKISVITLFPKMIEGFIQESIIKRAIEKKLVEVEFIDLRRFAIDSYGSVDDRPYGGGAGMVLRVEPVVQAIQSIEKKGKTHIILTSAQGSVYNQSIAKKYQSYDHLIILAGHYEGFDERILDYVDEEISLGDFILTGGEIVSAVIIDSVVRLIPTVLKKEEATINESFFTLSKEELQKANIEIEHGLADEVKLLEYPQYTRPSEFEGKKVPEVLLSGNPKKIYEWQIREAYKKTKKRRPDLLKTIIS